MAYEDVVKRLMGQFGGNPDDAGYWAGKLEAGQDPMSLVKNMSGRTLGEDVAGDIKGLMTGFGGNPDDASYWTDQASGGIEGFIGSDAFKNMTGQTWGDFRVDRKGSGGDGGGSGSGGGGAGLEIDFSDMGLQNNPEFKKLISDLQGLVPEYQKAVTEFSDLSKLLENYKAEAMGTGRVAFDDVWQMINQAGNVAAGRGMGSGTEQKALKSRMLSDLVKKEDERRLDILKNVTGLETTMRMAAPGTMFKNVQALMQLFGTEAADNLNWAQAISNVIQQGYTG